MEESVATAYVLTNPQQELVRRLGIEIPQNTPKEKVNRIIDAAVRVRTEKVCEANPVLVKNGYIQHKGVVRKISQIRGHRVQLTGGGVPQEWVTFFDIENAEGAPAPK
jgi:hypothetical protein